MLTAWRHVWTVASSNTVEPRRGVQNPLSEHRCCTFHQSMFLNSGKEGNRQVTLVDLSICEGSAAKYPYFVSNKREPILMGVSNSTWQSGRQNLVIEISHTAYSIAIGWISWVSEWRLLLHWSLLFWCLPHWCCLSWPPSPQPLPEPWLFSQLQLILGCVRKDLVERTWSKPASWQCNGCDPVQMMPSGRTLCHHMS